MIYCGTSGLVLPVPNKLHFPEAYQHSSRLTYYGALVNSLEVNSSFYKIPQKKTVCRWATEVPSDFKFTFKVFREITHSAGLQFSSGLIERFMEVISEVGQKKGSVLVQFPPSVNYRHWSQILSILAGIREYDTGFEWHLAVEFRHPSFYIDAVFETLGQLNIAVVIHDRPPAVTPIREQGAEFMYLRFHGPEGTYKGSYEKEVLEEHAGLAKEWIDQGKVVYAYFNNTIGEAFTDMQFFMQMLKILGVS